MENVKSLGQLIREQMDESARRDTALTQAAMMLVGVPDGGAVVVPFHKAPDELRAYSRNGGDEDHVIVHTEEWLPWAYKLAACGEEDTYKIGERAGITYYVSITAHS